MRLYGRTVFDNRVSAVEGTFMINATRWTNPITRLKPVRKPIATLRDALVETGVLVLRRLRILDGGTGPILL